MTQPSIAVKLTSPDSLAASTRSLAESRSTSSLTARVLLAASRLVIPIVILISMGLAGWKLLGSANLQWSHLTWSMTTALVLAIAYRVINAYGWTLVLRAMGTHVDGGTATRLWLISESRRWLPGSVWGYVSRASMANKIGIPLPIGVASMLLELMLVIAAAGLMVVPGLLYSAAPVANALATWGPRLVLPTLLGCVVVGAIVALGGHRVIARKWHHLRSRWEHLKHMSIDRSRLVRAGAFFVMMNGMNGIITAFITYAADSQHSVQFLAIVAASSAAWLIGFFAIFSPGGLIVREAAFAAMLLPWLPYTEALTIAVLARLLQFIAEAVVIVWIAAERGWTTWRKPA
jgi:glycosyltransferase 2 family protein